MWPPENFWCINFSFCFFDLFLFTFWSIYMSKFILPLLKKRWSFQPYPPVTWAGMFSSSKAAIMSLVPRSTIQIRVDTWFNSRDMIDEHHAKTLQWPAFEILSSCWILYFYTCAYTMLLFCFRFPFRLWQDKQNHWATTRFMASCNTTSQA